MFFYAEEASSPEDYLFDMIVGALQDVVMEPTFSSIQETFKQKHCHIFEEGEENKNEYMAIFIQYQNIVEKYIVE